MRRIGLPQLIRIGRSRVPGSSEREYDGADYSALHLFYTAGSVVLGGDPYKIAPGAMMITPRGARSVYTTGEPLEHVFVHFRARDGAGELTPIPAEFFPPSRELESAASGLLEALTVSKDDPDWAAVKLWDVLLALDHRSVTFRRTDTHPAVISVTGWIERNLPVQADLSRLAEVGGVSPTHLNRLFQETFGTSAVRYLRNRRMDMAHYLLTGTTLSVGEIAYQVGIPDVHAFNKLCKRYYGCAPSVLRGAQFKEPG
jgi:AraC-like DNA-binding protein